MRKEKSWRRSTFLIIGVLKFGKFKHSAHVSNEQQNMIRVISFSQIDDHVQCKPWMCLVGFSIEECTGQRQRFRSGHEQSQML